MAEDMNEWLIERVQNTILSCISKDICLLFIIIIIIIYPILFIKVKLF